METLEQISYVGARALLLLVIVVFFLFVLWLVGGSMFQHDKQRREDGRGRGGGGDDEWEPAPPVVGEGVHEPYASEPTQEFPAALCTPSRRPLTEDGYAREQVEYLQQRAWGRGPHHQPQAPAPAPEPGHAPTPEPARPEQPIAVPNWPQRVRR